MPLSYSTAEAEIQIRTSEFDSQPKTVRLVGSAAPFNGPGIDINDKMSNSEGVAGTKTLLMSTKQSGKPKLSKIKVTE